MVPLSLHPPLRPVRAGLGALSPLCSSSASACDSSSTTFAGQRPAGADVNFPAARPWFAPTVSPVPKPAPLRLFTMARSSLLIEIRHPSTLSAPVPHASTFAATVPARGLRATTTGSNALAPPAAWGTCGVLAVALAVAESARVARNLRTVAANRLSTAEAVEPDVSAGVGLLGVLVTVSDDIEDHKVLRSVVASVVVDVVDVLVSSQSSAQHALHDDTVLQGVGAVVSSDHDVAVRSDVATAAPVGVVDSCPASCGIAALAGAVAVLASGEAAGVGAELLAAPFALGLHSSSRRVSSEPTPSRIPPMTWGFLATTTGSWLGFSAVPQPANACASVEPGR